jgi:uncharacterized membrane protein YphA (DoxX/SURF4 family)
LPTRRLHEAATVIDDGLRSLLFDGFRFVVGIVWVVAAVAKARAGHETRDDVRRLAGGGPAWALNGVAQVVPVAELALGLMLILGWHTRAAAGISAALFVFFAVLIGGATIRGALREGGCGCFGSRPGTSDHVTGPRAIARNFVLAALAVAVAVGAT